MNENSDLDNNETGHDNNKNHMKKPQGKHTCFSQYPSRST